MVLPKTDAVSSLKFRFISARFIDARESSSGISLLLTSVLINTLWLPIFAGIWVFSGALKTLMVDARVGLEHNVCFLTFR